MNVIVALQLLSELHREFDCPEHVAYVDLKLASDSVGQTSSVESSQENGYATNTP